MMNERMKSMIIFLWCARWYVCYYLLHESL